MLVKRLRINKESFSGIQGFLTEDAANDLSEIYSYVAALGFFPKGSLCS